MTTETDYEDVREELREREEEAAEMRRLWEERREAYGDLIARLDDGSLDLTPEELREDMEEISR